MAFLLFSGLQAKNNYLIRDNVSHKMGNDGDNNGG